ncbi:MAG: autotransporter-associated beta strand repeat-containing protein [Akkermansia sp.]|nr:autotransporter-associated beta strand repeat-containing protein [Akkermansia sp.]
MKLHLNLSLRRALLAAMALVATLASPAQAGLADERYDLQYYLDFSYNRGMFTAGASNIEVFYKNGGSASNPVIAIMPNLDSFGSKGELLPIVGFSDAGGSGLIAPQFLESAAHCGETDVSFVTQNGSYGISYSSTGYSSQGGIATADWSIQRLDKIVTEVAYTPYATDEFMRTLKQNTWMYRVGEGTRLDTSGGVQTNGSAMGGLLNIENIHQKGNNTWIIYSVLREEDTPGDVAPPLQISCTAGDSGSPVYAWDAENQRFVQVGFCSGANKLEGYNSDVYIDHNPTAIENFMASCTTNAHEFSGTETIIWGKQDTTSGKGMLTQGSTGVEYIGSGSDNTSYDHKGLSFSTEDTTNTQVLELQGSVNMGAGSLSFDKGSWKLTETEPAAENTFNSAGFIVNSGADLTLELTGASNEEWRKVGEGTMTIAGSGNNEATLRVGGGTTVYNVTYDEAGNVTGCTLGNKGETRLDRTDGYAASSVRLEGGVAILVLMQDGQFKTNSVAGDTFSFGNAGGLLNLNGHDLSWGVINQYGSETGARIGNMTTQDRVTPNKTSTFTYTGTGTFAGCFMDEGAQSTAQLAVKYNNADNGTWTLTGNHTNVGGFTVEAGTLKLQGSLTPHAGGMSDANDWTYATLSGSNVTVKDGATFQLSHHALMQGDITVESGGNLVINQTVNADYESIQGSLQQNMHGSQGTGLFNSLVGNVYLNSTAGTLDNPGKVASMVVDTNSSVITTLKGNVISDTSGSTGFVSFTKQGSGIFVVDGQMQVARGTVNEGGLVIKDSTGFLGLRTSWTIGEQGFMAIEGLDNQTAVNCISTGSSGVLALTGDQATELQNLGIRSNLIIGAWGDISYGTADATLSTVTDATYGNVWRLGGGTGTLTVNFKLTGDAHLLIGNEWSSGTVHLTNTANDFTGDIYIQGTGNKLTYVDGALGAARVNLTYGNAIAFNDASQLSIIKEGSNGVIATSTSGNLDLSGTSLSLGANGTFTYTGTLTVDDTYHFGGSGDLTLDTELSGASSMKIDGQGTEGSSVTFARENAFAGDITAGGGMELAEPNSKGQINIHAGHANALAATSSVVLNKGAVLHTDGNDICVQNLTANAGSLIRNEGTSSGNLLLRVTEGTSTTIADGVLVDSADTSALHLVKTGKGTLTMATNSSWTGGMTISEGTVFATLSGDGYLNASGGIGSSSSVINLEKEGTLQLVIGKTNGSDRGKLGSTLLPQTVLGSGTIVLSSGGEALLFSNQQPTFNGTVQLKDNTRLYIGDIHGDINYNSVNNLKALAGSTVVVESGSQAKVTNTHRWGKQAAISTTANFTISGNGYAGLTNWNILASRLTSGALAIDNNSTVYGNITLADDAMISSSSAGTLKYYSPLSGLIPGDTSGYPNNATYGTINHLGGNIRGRILGEGKTLTFGGNEGMTITADSANTFGDLIIASSNGNNDDKFALRLNGGKAESQTSTALGTGKVTINDGLILRLAGTGTANQSDVVYTYANNIDAGNGATIQSYNITNKLTGVVTAAGDLNLATAQGGVLNLAGGVSGTGTLNIGAGSDIILGSAAGATFEGSVNAGSGAILTLDSPTALSNSTIITGTDSLFLNLHGTADYTLAGITTEASQAQDMGAVLTLGFDFTNVTTQNYTTLSIGRITATSTLINLQLNLLEELDNGTYVLIDGRTDDSLSSIFSLSDDLDGRLSLSRNNGQVILTVGNDSRFFWSSDENSGLWNTSDTNWKKDGNEGTIAYSAGSDVMLNASGLSTPGTHEVITVAEDISAGSISVNSLYELSGSGSLSGSKLTVAAGGYLELGANATFTDGVLVNNARLEVDANTLAAHVTAENKAQVALNGTAVQGNITVRENSTVALDASSVTGSIAVSEESSLSMNNASVSGSINLSGTGSIITENNSNSEGSGVARLSGSLNADGSGSLSLIDGSVTLNHTIALDSLSIAGGKTVTIWNAEATSGADKNIKSVELGAGAVLQSNDRAEMTSSTGLGIVQLNGNSATIQDVHHSGSFTVDTLKLGAGISSATLNLKKQAASTWSTLFKLGNETSESGNFAGTIALNESHNGSKRSAFLILGNKDIAKNAVIDLLEAQSADAHIGLGINTASATIAGLNSTAADAGQAKLFSGTINERAAWNTGDTSAPGTVGTALRTLTIDTVTGGNYTFHGEVLGNLNLVKDGAGKQTFSGNSAKFNGSIEILDGTLALTGDALNMLSTASRVDVNGGTLDLSAMNFEISGGISLSSTFSISETGALQFGNLSKDTTYSIFDLTGGGQLSGWDTLTASNFIINGANLGATTRTSVQVSMDGSFSYSILEDREVTWTGDSTTSTWSEKATIPSWTTGEPAESTAFVNFDSVVFNSNADLTLEGSIHVNDLTLSEGVSLKTSGQLTVHGKTTLGNGFSWDFSGDTTLKFTEDQLKSASSIVVGEGATLVMTGKKTDQNKTSSAFNNVSGAGDVELNLAMDNGIGFNLSNITGDITVATGRLQINTSTFNETSSIRVASSSSELVFNNSCELKNDVILEADTTIHVNKPSSGVYEGRISGDLLGEGKMLRKSGGSNLILAGRTVLKELETNTGKVIIDSISAYIETVDGSINGSATGSLYLSQNAILNVTGDVLSRSNTGIHLEKGAVLALLGHGVTIINEKGEDTSLKATNASQKYSLASTNYEVKNARVVYTGSEDATLSNMLTNVTLENSISNAAAPALEDGSESTFYAGSTLKVTNADNTLNGVIAYGGDVALHNLQDGTSLNLLEIATGRTVSAYVGSQLDEKSTITVTETAQLGSASVLNASLTLANGATLEMDAFQTEPVILTGTLTFAGQVELGKNLLAAVNALSGRDELVLFTGLSDVIMPTVTAGDLESPQVLANSVFSNVQNENLYVNYQVIDNVGFLMVVHVPEPTTTTLSLLALSALAARRRRK